MPKTIQRRLPVIVAADVVGYGRLIAADETGTLAAMRAHRVELWVAPATPGGRGRIVTPEPGHYLEPVFSPTGEQIVYRKSSGGFVRSPLYSRDTGLYLVSTAGGEAERILRQGVRPHFGASADRVYFQTFEDEDRRTLRSIELDGSDERTHIDSEAATEFRVSPDGKWVAFTERFNAYIAPFVRTGKKVELGPKSTSMICVVRSTYSVCSHPRPDFVMPQKLAVAPIESVRVTSQAMAGEIVSRPPR